ncbi:MAG: aldo/keto reductase [Rhizobiales bacterium]|nr:aldo/keto reductase [Hyphomicrobiales bacterium]
MERRKLGKDGPEVSAVSLGLMSLSGLYGPSDEESGVAFVQYAIDRGVNFLDSSDAYGNGQNETLLGKALKGRRDKVILATKFGQKRGPAGTVMDGTPAYVMEACEASLKRLGVDVIDVYFQHRVDPNVPIEDTVGAMKRLVEQGKARWLGLSEASPETIRRAHKVHPMVAVESEYSLLYRKEAEETLPVTRELGLSYVPYSPLGRSMLTATVNTADDVASDRRADHPRFKGDNLARNRKLVGALEAMAARKGCTPAQVAIAWVLAQGPDIVPIPGTKRKERLEENLGALSVKLSKDEVAELSAAFPVGAAAGTRYPEGQMKTVYI